MRIPNKIMIIFVLIILLILSSLNFISVISEDNEELNGSNTTRGTKGSGNYNRTVKDITIFPNGSLLDSLNLRKNHIITDLKLDLTIDDDETRLEKQAFLDFTTTSSEPDSGYPNNITSMGDDYLFAGSNGSSLFRSMFGIEITDNLSSRDIIDSKFLLRTVSESSLNHSAILNRTYQIFLIGNASDGENNTWNTQPALFFEEPVGVFSINPFSEQDNVVQLNRTMIGRWYNSSSTHDHLWLMINDTNESGLHSESLVAFQSRITFERDYPSFVVTHRKIITNLSMGVWIFMDEMPPEQDWIKIGRSKYTELVLDPTILQSKIDSAQVQFDGNLITQVMIAFNQTQAFEKIRIDISWDYADTDGDGYPDDVDEFPLDPDMVFAQQTDTDNDGVPDVLDPHPNDNTDSDGDTISDDYEVVISKTDPNNPDTDGDGYRDDVDELPNDPTEQFDNDNDGIGDLADQDDDNDGYNDTIDEVPFLATQWIDTDGDGYGDNRSGLDPDIYPSDPSLWNPMQLPDNYTNFESEFKSFKIEYPGSWKLTENSADYDYLGYTVHYTVTFREPEAYTASARVTIREIEEEDVVDSDEYVRDVVAIITAEARDDIEDFKIVQPVSISANDGSPGKLVVQYTRGNVEYQGKWIVAVSEVNGLIFIIMAETTVERYSVYEPYLDESLDSFEIEEDDSEILIICVVIIIIVLANVALYIMASKKKRERMDKTMKERPRRIEPFPQPPPQSRAPGTVQAPPRAQKSAYSQTLYCNVCEGIGKCTACDGFGTVGRGFFGQNIATCSNCKGTGICPSCRPAFVGIDSK